MLGDPKRVLQQYRHEADLNIVSMKVRCGSITRRLLACSALREILCLERRQIRSAERKLVRYRHRAASGGLVKKLAGLAISANGASARPFLRIALILSFILGIVSTSFYRNYRKSG